MAAPLPPHRLLRKPLTEPQDTDVSSRPERRRPRRHKCLIAMRLRQLRETPCIKMRSQFLRLLDLGLCLNCLTINDLYRI